MEEAFILNSNKNLCPLYNLVNSNFIFYGIVYNQKLTKLLRKLKNVKKIVNIYIDKLINSKPETKLVIHIIRY